MEEMEKTGNNEFVIFTRNNEVVMRCPGGAIVKYDGRFGDVALNETKVIPNE